MEFLLGDRSVSCLEIQPEFDETSMAPVFYQGDGDYPSSIQVCRVLDSRTKIDAILEYEVAEKYWAGEDIMQRPLFYFETVHYYDVDSDKARIDRICRISYDEERNSWYDDRKEEYPYLFLPNAIQDAVRGWQPREPSKPHPPKKPEGRPIKDSLLSLLLWVPLVLVSTILTVLFIAIRVYGGIFWAIVIGVVLGFIIRGIIVSKYGLVAASEMNQEERQYKIAFEAYENRLKEYQEDLKVYEDRASRYKEYSHSEYVSYLLGVCLDEYTPPTIAPNVTVVKQGPAEHFFLGYLKERMNDDFEVLSNLQTEHYFRDGEKAYYYYPDIVLRNKPTGLMIDIEIDEPYVAKTGKPIHCYKDDEDRNYALVEDNWIVLRFTEEQIIRYPDICLAYIRTVCSSILTHTGCNIPTTWEFSQRHWSSYEASQMADSNYRLKYLPQDAHSSVYVPKKSIPANQNNDIVDLPF